jgi:MmyB-like transcription regulator ligand binding domain
MKKRAACWESFRVNFDFWSDAPEFVASVADPERLSPEFRRWWKDHGVRTRSSGEKTMRHPNLGAMTINYATFQANDDPRLTLVVYSSPILAKLRAGGGRGGHDG